MIEYNSQEKQDSLSHVRFADEELIKTQVLQGEAAQTIIQGKNCSVYKMENETGEGVITRYPVFPGIELLYDDIHMSCGVAHREDPRADLLEINHCRLGRFECEFSDGSAVYLGEGDLAVNVMTNRTRETWFPLSHYHGITIAVDIPVADRVLRQVSEALGEGLYCDLFAMRDRLCACDSCFIMRATESIQHIFSELYHAPEDLRAGYFKLKVMELFLFLGSPEITAHGEERPYVDRAQVEQIKSVRQYLVEHLDRRITLQMLSQTFSFPLTSMKKCFKEVYGTTINAYLQAYRMHTAAGLLRETKLDDGDCRPGGIPERQQVFRGVPTAHRTHPNGIPKNFLSYRSRQRPAGVVKQLKIGYDTLVRGGICQKAHRVRCAFSLMDD